jgi:hypothetical protein
MVIKSMNRNQLAPVYLYVIDEFGQVFSDITQRFENTEKYTIRSFTSFGQFMDEVETIRIPGIRKSPIRIIICVLNRHQENYNPIDESKKILSQTDHLPDVYSIIFLVDSKFKDDGQPVLEAGAGAWIINNPNAIHWIDNHVKATISRNNLDHRRRASFRSFRILLIYVILVLLLTILAKFIFPWYF